MLLLCLRRHMIQLCYSFLPWPSSRVSNNFQTFWIAFWIQKLLWNLENKKNHEILTKKTVKASKTEKAHCLISKPYANTGRARDRQKWRENFWLVIQQFYKCYKMSIMFRIFNYKQCFKAKYIKILYFDKIMKTFQLYNSFIQVIKT